MEKSVGITQIAIFIFLAAVIVFGVGYAAWSWLPY